MRWDGDLPCRNEIMEGYSCTALPKSQRGIFDAVETAYELENISILPPSLTSFWKGSSSDIGASTARLDSLGLQLFN
jgi:hypothetical protein